MSADNGNKKLAMCQKYHFLLLDFCIISGEQGTSPMIRQTFKMYEDMCKLYVFDERELEKEKKEYLDSLPMIKDWKHLTIEQINDSPFQEDIEILRNT